MKRDAYLADMDLLAQLTSAHPPSDESFDAIFPPHISKAVEFHFTPIEVAKVAAQFLVPQKNIKVLDIGAGAGKFCMVGAACTPGIFTGVELRKSLVTVAEELRIRFEISNVHYLQTNITEVDFSAYQAFYHFNAFYEHVDRSGEIDDSIQLDKPLFKLYSNYVKEQLAAMPVGTRLATYFSYGDEVPDSYKTIARAFDGKLVLREKK